MMHCMGGQPGPCVKLSSRGIAVVVVLQLPPRCHNRLPTLKKPTWVNSIVITTNMLPHDGSVRDKGSASGPYGPSNPPPPPASPPPEDSTGKPTKSSRKRPLKKKRERAYAAAEEEQTRGRSEQTLSPSNRNDHRHEQSRGRSDRSLSPDRNDRRREKSRFRERTPLRFERADERTLPANRCGVPEEIQDLGRRSPLRNKRNRITEGNDWSPKEGANAVPRYSHARYDSYDQYGGGSAYGAGRENRLGRGHDAYRPAYDRPEYDRPEKTTSRTGYDNHQEADSYARASGTSYLDSGHTMDTRAPRLGLPHLLDAKDIQMPPTVYDLRVYNTRINTHYEKLPKYQQFRNGFNGKISPAMYGSETLHDLGLCFATFLTRHVCEIGLECPWRHHPLSLEEKIWIIEYGKERGKEFLANVEKSYTYPCMPVPGANLHGMAE
ncbi:hypothetical protein GMOD_00006622 [Pyrenophora seminiperda CCB06]|uniref:Uncharacterized protein n=1 Tax=Pyrenophora seminiperda CCB06 TaxID=1302712 RepID=A0A3M7MAK3_9PLEO|nr:hypothetical protein GMOD_00006622 [Pyrenophora seminiperda CCB06]